MVSITLLTITITCLIIVNPHSHVSANPILDLLSDLSQSSKSNANKQPVVVVISKDLLNENPRQAPKPQLLERDDDSELFNVLHLALDKHQFKKRTTRPQPYTIKGIYRSQRDRRPDEEEKQFLRSPIVKSLLRISNALRCNAQDQCKDLCSDKFSGKQQINCQITCKVTYDCKDTKKEEDYEDPCQDDNCNNSCNGSTNDCQYSTKGETMASDVTQCSRC